MGKTLVHDLFDFTGKKYIVTGASSGIGRSTAVALSNRGGCVVLAGRDEEKLKETRESMQGDSHLVFPVDLTQELDLREFLSMATEDGKKIDGLVHSAGVASFFPLNSITKDRISQCMDINVYSFLHLVKYATKRKYRADSMSIVAVSSINAMQPKKCQTIYAMSKAAVNIAVQTLAMELSDKNIRINSICPGTTKTRMTEEAADRGDNLELERQLMGMLKPEQVAQSILYLLSDASSAMTGRILYADGGNIA